MDCHENLLLGEQYLCQANTALLNSPRLSGTGHNVQEVCLTSQEYVLSNKENPQIIILVINTSPKWYFTVNTFAKHQTLSLLVIP